MFKVKLVFRHIEHVLDLGILIFFFHLFLITPGTAHSSRPGPENTGNLGSRIPGNQGVLEAASKKKRKKEGKTEKNRVILKAGKPGFPGS